jgi:hypothetical protein
MSLEKLRPSWFWGSGVVRPGGRWPNRKRPTGSVGVPMCLPPSSGITGFDVTPESHEDNLRALATPSNGFLYAVELRFLIELGSASG